MRALPRNWFRVSERERVIHRILGVGVFRWFLERSGWEHSVHRRTFTRTKTGVFSLQAALRSKASAHGTCFATQIVLAALAVANGHAWSTLWILLPRASVHLYPVLLQRSLMLRLQPLVARTHAAISMNADGGL